MTNSLIGLLCCKLYICSKSVRKESKMAPNNQVNELYNHESTEIIQKLLIVENIVF